MAIANNGDIGKRLKGLSETRVTRQREAGAIGASARKGGTEVAQQHRVALLERAPFEALADENRVGAAYLLSVSEKRAKGDTGAHVDLKTLDSFFGKAWSDLEVDAIQHCMDRGLFTPADADTVRARSYENLQAKRPLLATERNWSVGLTTALAAPLFIIGASLACTMAGAPEVGRAIGAYGLPVLATSYIGGKVVQGMQLREKAATPAERFGMNLGDKEPVDHVVGFLFARAADGGVLEPLSKESALKEATTVRTMLSSDLTKEQLDRSPVMVKALQRYADDLTSAASKPESEMGKAVWTARATLLSGGNAAQILTGRFIDNVLEDRPNGALDYLTQAAGFVATVVQNVDKLDTVAGKATVLRAARSLDNGVHSLEDRWKNRYAGNSIRSTWERLWHADVNLIGNFMDARRLGTVFGIANEVLKYADIPPSVQKTLKGLANDQQKVLGQLGAEADEIGHVSDKQILASAQQCVNLLYNFILPALEPATALLDAPKIGKRPEVKSLGERPTMTANAMSISRMTGEPAEPENLVAREVTASLSNGGSLKVVFDGVGRPDLSSMMIDVGAKEATESAQRVFDEYARLNGLPSPGVPSLRNGNRKMAEPYQFAARVGSKVLTVAVNPIGFADRSTLMEKA